MTGPHHRRSAAADLCRFPSIRSRESRADVKRRLAPSRRSLGVLKRGVRPGCKHVRVTGLRISEEELILAAVSGLAGAIARYLAAFGLRET